MFENMCGVAIPFWLPIDFNISMWKYFLIFCNAYNLGYILPKGASVTILYYGFLVFAVDRIDFLISIFEELNPRMEEKKAREKFKFCVEYYTEIARLVDDINDTVGVIFAPMQNGLVSIIIAVLEYQALMGKGAIAFFPLSLWLILQAVACRCGQTLEDASTRLRSKVYGMPWYQMKISFQKDFRIFHAQVQKGFHLKMKPSIFMNMEYYYQFMNGSYSILMFLVNMERKNMK
ncbi:uncharacterized protein LOC123673501 [Harmonia axyridis]|uniref:uncharacterized protein LOC123673501 n=1 Tax=Harmonia axyridis TaxID=115357 RepID=UPI001E276D99|nr:uncharacterized protein LOC123673501 [Harmonia axyridis]